jgi:hypothetical protein
MPDSAAPRAARGVMSIPEVLNVSGAAVERPSMDVRKRTRLRNGQLALNSAVERVEVVR